MNKFIKFFGAVCLALVAIAVIAPETVMAAAPAAANTPGGIMAADAKANFNAATFFLIILAVICFVAAIVFVLKKEFAIAGAAFVSGIFAIGLTSCVNKMTGNGAMPDLANVDMPTLQGAFDVVRHLV